MIRRDLRWVFGLMVCLAAAGFVLPGSANSQDQADVQKIYADIAGTYEFVYEGESLIIIFHVKDGQLYGREESDDEDVEIKTVDLSNLKFEATVQSSGQYYEIGFSRDENGKISKCRLVSGGIEIDGTRVK